MKRLALTALLALTLITTSASTQVTPWRSVKQLTFPAGSCTAFKVGKHWFSAAHCVSAGGPFLIDGVEAEVAAVARNYDLVAFDGGPDAPGLKLAGAAPVISETPLHTGGYLYALPLLIFRGYLAGYVEEDALYDMTAGPGMSGAPILNQRDEVVGIVQFGPYADAAPLTGGLRFTYLRALILAAP